MEANKNKLIDSFKIGEESEINNLVISANPQPTTEIINKSKKTGVNGEAIKENQRQNSITVVDFNNNEISVDLSTVVEKNTDFELYTAATEKELAGQLKDMKRQYKALEDRLKNDLITSNVEKNRTRRAFLNIYRQQLLTVVKKNYASTKEYGYYLKKLNDLDDNVTANIDKNSFVVEKSAKLYAEDNQLTHYEKSIDKEKNIEGLNPAQLRGVNEIDRWLLDNTNNGGLFRSKFDQFDFVGELLQMTKRERLYVYYLVMSDQRKYAPTQGQFKISANIIPDLELFKKKMMPTKAKFYKYFTGKYVYWHKLGEAMRHARFISNASANIPVSNLQEDAVAKIDIEKKEQVDYENQINTNLINIESNDRQNILNAGNNVVRTTIDEFKKASAQLLSYAENNKEISKDDQKFNGLVNNLIITGQNVVASGNAFENTLIKNNISVPGMRGQFLQQNGGSDGFLGSKAFLDEAVSDADFIAGKTIAIRDLIQSINLGEFYGIGSNGAAFLLGVVGSLYTLIKSGGSASWSTFTEMTMGVLNSFGKAALAISSSIKVATEGAAKSATLFGKLTEEGTKFTDLLPSNAFQITGAAVGGVTAIYGTTQVVSGLTRKYHVRKAEDKLLNGENTLEQRYARGMTNIARYHAQKKANDGGIAFTLGIATLGTAMLPGIGSLAGLCIGAVGFGIGMIMKIVRSYGDDTHKDTMFDEYFNMETIYSDAIAKYNEEHPQANDKIKNQIRKEVRKKMMAKLGFARQRDAANYIATQYATIIMSKLKSHNAVEQEGYIQLVKALGLHYNKENGKPTLGALISKLSA